MILAGDIGGTKCNLAAFEERDATLQLVFQNRYATRDFSSFEQLMDTFCGEGVWQGATKAGVCISAAGFGVAGTVVDGRLYAINLPWVLDVRALAGKLGLHVEDIVLMNDLVATACGLENL